MLKNVRDEMIRPYPSSDAYAQHTSFETSPRKAEKQLPKNPASSGSTVAGFKKEKNDGASKAPVGQFFNENFDMKSEVLGIDRADRAIAAVQKPIPLVVDLTADKTVNFPCSAPPRPSKPSLDPQQAVMEQDVFAHASPAKRAKTNTIGTQKKARVSPSSSRAISGNEAFAFSSSFGAEAEQPKDVVPPAASDAPILERPSSPAGRQKSLVRHGPDDVPLVDVYQIPTRLSGKKLPQNTNNVFHDDKLRLPMMRILAERPEHNQHRKTLLALPELTPRTVVSEKLWQYPADQRRLISLSFGRDAWFRLAHYYNLNSMQKRFALREYSRNECFTSSKESSFVSAFRGLISSYLPEGESLPEWALLIMCAYLPPELPPTSVSEVEVLTLVVPDALTSPETSDHRYLTTWKNPRKAMLFAKDLLMKMSLFSSSAPRPVREPIENTSSPSFFSRGQSSSSKASEQHYTPTNREVHSGSSVQAKAQTSAVTSLPDPLDRVSVTVQESQQFFRTDSDDLQTSDIGTFMAKMLTGMAEDIRVAEDATPSLAVAHKLITSRVVKIDEALKKLTNAESLHKELLRVQARRELLQKDFARVIEKLSSHG